jgi:hypothetical protein
MKPKKITAYVVFWRWPKDPPMWRERSSKKDAETDARWYRKHGAKVVVKTVTVTL